MSKAVTFARRAELDTRPQRASASPSEYVTLHG